ncbi:MAG: MgtC/SapB family protein [Lachnospiraceae bacterium]|nr:MgtC/SapB family protein [Lachnospiraceae bacterium]
MGDWQALLTNNLEQAGYALRILVAGICGGLIGLERSRRQKEAGIRTHIIVAIGASLMMIVSKYGFFDIGELVGVDADASRIASNIITGISFLGAGVIFVKNDYIKGLTTAAGIWATAGIAMAIGAGMYLLGVITTLLIIILQIALHHLPLDLDSSSLEDVMVTIKNNDEAYDEMQKCMMKYMRIQGIKLQKKDKEEITFKIIGKMKSGFTNEEIMSIVRENKYIKSIML